MKEIKLKSAPRSTVVRYALATVISLLVMTAGFLLELWVAMQLPFITFFPVVAGTAWLLGYGPALLTLALSVVLVSYFFLPPELAFSLSGESIAPLLVFVLASALVIAMGDFARRRHREAEEMAESLKKSEERMRVTLLELQESRERQEIAVNAAGLGVFELHRKEKFVLWENRRMYEIFGHDPTEAPVDTEEFINSYIHEDDREAFLKSLKQAWVPGQPYHLVCRFRRKSDGQVRWLETVGRSEFDANMQPLKVIGVARDITAQKVMEEEIKRTHKQLQTILDTVPAYIYQIDANDCYVFANRAYSKLVNIPVEELVGRHVNTVFEPHIAKPFIKHNHELLSGKETREYEETAPWSDGVHVYSSVKTPLFHADGRPGGILGISTDITQRTRMEQALRESDQRKDEFLAILGHELRNPLAPIKTGLELLQRAQAGPDKARNLLEMMQRQADHLARLVDDLLDLSRISRGTIALRKEVVDINELLEAAVEQVQALMGQRNHLLELEMSPVTLCVDGDSERLTQVMVNLLTNAAKYMAPGGKVVVDTRREDETVVLRVRDTGYGIPEDQLDNVFAMFAQVQAHKELTGGSGLGVGLSLSRQIVELHGGRIFVSGSKVGHGTELTVILPLAEAPAVCKPAPAETVITHGESRRVLLIDDNADAVDSLGEILSLNGHTVRVEHSGKAGLDAVKDFVPDVILLDIGLPGMDGYEVARRIRSLPEGASVSLFALTGWGLEKDKQKAIAAGFDEHLTKPVDTARLLALFPTTPRLRAQTQSSSPVL